MTHCQSGHFIGPYDDCGICRCSHDKGNHTRHIDDDGRCGAPKCRCRGYVNHDPNGVIIDALNRAQASTTRRLREAQNERPLREERRALHEPWRAKGWTSPACEKCCCALKLFPTDPTGEVRSVEYPNWCQQCNVSGQENVGTFSDEPSPANLAGLESDARAE